MRPAATLLFLLCTCASGVRAWDTKRNPDRWTTLDASVSGSDSLPSSQQSASATTSSTTTVKAVSVSIFNNLLIPLTDSLTVSLGVGAIASGSDTGGGASTASNSVVTYQAGLRHYLLETELTGHGAARNPDQWPSLSLSAGGSSTVDYAANSTSGADRRSTNNWSRFLSADVRLPLADSLTVVPALTATYANASVSETQATAGSRTITRILSPSLQMRYFLVGENGLVRGEQKNPDEWTMLSFSVGGSRSLSIDQRFFLQDKQSRRNNTSDGVSVAAGLRLPVTDHCSLRFDLSYALNESHAPRIPPPAQLTENEVNTRLASIGFAAAFRYFFF